MAHSPIDDLLSDFPVALEAELRETAHLVDALGRELDGIIESMDRSNNDDEHDPDGSTNGYERAKATSLLRHASAKLADLSAARERVAAGRYGVCEACNEPIVGERLAVLPGTPWCATCAF